jgi:hypothetical protein
MDPNARESHPGPSRRRVWLALPAAALPGLCLAASVFPHSDAAAWGRRGPRHRPRGGPPDPGDVRVRVDFFAERALRRVDASDEQTLRVKEIPNASAEGARRQSLQPRARMLR